MSDRNIEGSEARARFTFGKGYKPAFGDEVGLGMYEGAREGDDHPLRTYAGVIAAAGLLIFSLLAVLVVVLLH
jgi:hypothetical protein